jgi:transposase
VSNVLLRVVRALPVPDQNTQQDLRLLGIDDFALRRGHVYGTVLVDLDTHRPIDLLPARTAEPVATWLRQRPAVEVVCRDRAGAYAQAAADATPGAIQVADRWHLWHNLAQHVERAVAAHRRCWSQPLQVTPDEGTPSEGTPSEGRPSEGTPSEGTPSEGTPPEGKCGRLAARNGERWQLVHDLLAEGVSLKQISRRTGLARGTVHRFARASQPADLDHGSRPSHGSSLDAHRTFLADQWRAGNTNAADLLRQLHARGYRGSGSHLRQYVRPWRTAPPDPQPGTVTCTRPASATTRDVTCWICTRPEDLEHDQAAGLAAVLSRCEHLNRLTEHVRTFARLLTTLAGEQLNTWIRAVQDDTGQPQLMSFVRGILADYNAVRAGLTLHHNSGPVEGNVNRIKMIKRKLSGRANFDLLRTLVVLGP